MNGLRGLALLLLAAGALALVYGGFTYTRKTHEAEVGPVSFAVRQSKTVNVPAWAGVASVVAGGVLLFGQRKK